MTTATTAQRFSLATVARRSASLPDRIVLYGPPSWGKTSFAARMPGAIVLMTPGEDRLKKLIEQGLCPETPHFPDLAETWGDVTEAVAVLTEQAHDYKTLVIDTGNGAERLAHELVCAEEYQGDWGEHGFARYGAGEKVAADRLWVPFLTALDRLRERRRMRVVLLCHSGVVSVKNPEAGDYDKVVPALSKRAWGYTAKWADLVLYGALEVQLAKDDPRSKLAKNKARGGRVRLLHCQPTAAYEAKNVHRLPPTIRLGDDHARAYEMFRAAFPRSAKPSGLKPATGTEPAPAAATATATSTPGSAASLKALRELIGKCRLTPADVEDFCAQHGVPTIEGASEEGLQVMIGDLASALAQWQKDQGGREPGEDEPGEAEGQ